MRKWSPTECENSEKGETVYQILVPTVYIIIIIIIKSLLNHC